MQGRDRPSDQGLPARDGAAAGVVCDLVTGCKRVARGKGRSGRRSPACTLARRVGLGRRLSERKHQHSHDLLDCHLTGLSLRR